MAGHDGPFHLAISSRSVPLLRGLELFHGKHGAGVGVETQVQTRPGDPAVDDPDPTAGDLKLVAAQRQRAYPGPVLQIGNTDSRLQVQHSARPISSTPGASEGPTHHFALGVGNILPKIEKFASIANLELKVIC